MRTESAGKDRRRERTGSGVGSAASAPVSTVTSTPRGPGTASTRTRSSGPALAAAAARSCRSRGSLSPYSSPTLSRSRVRWASSSSTSPSRASMVENTPRAGSGRIPSTSTTRRAFTIHSSSSACGSEPEVSPPSAALWYQVASCERREVSIDREGRGVSTSFVLADAQGGTFQTGTSRSGRTASDRRCSAHSQAAGS